MRKSELIKLLNKIEGDPEVLLWNGFAQDWQDVYITKDAELVKYSLEHLFKSLKHELQFDKKDFNLTKEEKLWCYNKARTQYKEQEWETINSFVDEKQFKEWYRGNTKKVILINGENRNKTTWDRLGDINY